MTPPRPSPEAAASRISPRRLALQVIGFVIGLALLGWCIWTASSKGDWSAVLRADWRLVAGLLGSTLASLVINALMFWTALAPVRHHSVPRLIGLNAIGGLLNYAPIRLGLMARILYHLRVDRMRASLVASWMLVTAGLTVFTIVAMTGATLLSGGSVGSFVLTTALILAIGSQVMRLLSVSRVTTPVTSRLDGLGAMLASRPATFATMVLRAADIVAFAVRMACAAAILDLDLSTSDLLLLALSAQLFSLSPFGRLGFREAAVSFLAARLDSGFDSTAVDAVSAQLGLIESAGEAAIFIPAGLIAAPWYAAAMRRARGSPPANAPNASPPSPTQSVDAA